MNQKRDIADMHCDTIAALLELRERGQQADLRQNTLHVDLKRMQKSGYLLQNFALFVDKGAAENGSAAKKGITEKGGSAEKNGIAERDGSGSAGSAAGSGNETTCSVAGSENETTCSVAGSLHKKESPLYQDALWQKVQALLRVYKEEMERNSDLIVPALCWQDIERNRDNGRMSSLLTVEEGGVCRGQLSRLHTLYEKGVRMLTLTWNYENELGFPNLYRGTWQNSWNIPNTARGLSETGKVFVAEMEKLGMIPDVSHLSDAGFYDVLDCTKKPFAASHSNARSICPCVRNMTDDMIRRLAERGGVMGLNFCADFLTHKPDGVKNPGTVADIVLHAQHIVNVGGIECLGLGSDFDGIDTHEELPGAEKMERLADELERSGFTAAQIDKIFAGNVLRLYRELL